MNIFGHSLMFPGALCRLGPNCSAGVGSRETPNAHWKLFQLKTPVIPDTLLVKLLLVVVEAALLQEIFFLRLVSPNLLREEVMRRVLHSKGQRRKSQCRHCWCIRGETLPGEMSWHKRGKVEAWHVREAAGAWGGEGGHQCYGRDPGLWLQRSDLMSTPVLYQWTLL